MRSDRNFADGERRDLFTSQQPPPRAATPSRSHSYFHAANPPSMEHSKETEQSLCARKLCTGLRNCLSAPQVDRQERCRVAPSAPRSDAARLSPEPACVRRANPVRLCFFSRTHLRYTRSKSRKPNTIA